MEPTGAPTQADWGTWLQNVAQYGLQRKWDAEYSTTFTPNAQVPPPAAPAGGAAPSADNMPKWLIGIGIAGAIGLTLYALKD